MNVKILDGGKIEKGSNQSVYVNMIKYCFTLLPKSAVTKIMYVNDNDDSQ